MVQNGVILSREALSFDPETVTENQLEILTVHTTPLEKIVLFGRRSQENKYPAVIDLKNSSENFEWLTELQTVIKNQQCIVLYSQNDPLNGILGLTKCVRKENGGERTTCFLMHGETPDFDLNAEFYHKQLKKGFAINVYKDNAWGTYRHMPLEKTEDTESKHCFVSAVTKGDLSSLKWTEGPINSEKNIELGEELVYVSMIYVLDCKCN